MNMYTTPDQNTVVLWADEDTPQHLVMAARDSPGCRTTFGQRRCCAGFSCTSLPCLYTQRLDRRDVAFIPATPEGATQ